MNRQLFLLVLLGVMAFAQTSPPQVVSIPTDPLELSKIPPVGKNPLLDAQRCGVSEYFIRDNSPDMKPVGLRIGALVNSGGVTKMVFFLQPKWKTVIDGSKRVPTIEYVFPDGAAVAELAQTSETTFRLFTQKVNVTVRLSRAEYTKAASCLSKPSR